MISGEFDPKSRKAFALSFDCMLPLFQFLSSHL
jgi:hypothetical protein